MEIKKIEELIEGYQLDKALKELYNILENDSKNLKALALQGKILTKQQKYSDAINTFTEILNIDPENIAATTSIKMIDEILEMRRTFYFENPYTDDELYS